MMTTSRTPFVLFLVGFGASVLPASDLAHASSTGPPQGEVVRLPLEGPPLARGSIESLDGRHIVWEHDDAPSPTLSLGPLLPLRTLVALIERRVDRTGGREAGISMETLGPVLLVRGGAATDPAALQRATGTAQATIDEFRAMSDSLRFRTHVRLLSGDGGVPLADGSAGMTLVIDESRVLTSGERAAFGARHVRPVVADFDVEVASSISIADPITALVQTGETVHLWTSTVLDGKGVRRLHVQGLLDVAIEGPTRQFDPDVYDLGVLEQPTVHAAQVMFASTVVPGEPLIVTLEGLPESPSHRRLEISAEALLPPAASANEGASSFDASRVIDLGRGMWRAGLALPHAFSGEALRVAIPEARLPASAAQLLTLVFGRESGDRPDLGSAILLLPKEGGPTRSSVQSLFESIDPAGPEATLTVASRDDAFRATLPAARGALLRVARTVETVFIVDYEPQVASEATLSDPRPKLSMSGEVFECVVDWTDAGWSVTGVAEHRSIDRVAVREVDPREVGRIQQPATTMESTQVVLGAGETGRAASLEVTLEPR